MIFQVGFCVIAGKRWSLRLTLVVERFLMNPITSVLQKTLSAVKAVVPKLFLTAYHLGSLTVTALFQGNSFNQILFDQKFGKLDLTQKKRHAQNGGEKHNDHC